MFEYPSFGISTFYTYQFIENIHEMDAVLICFEFYTQYSNKPSQAFDIFIQ